MAGRNVLGCPELLAKASVVIWVDLQDEPDICAIRRLRADHRWIPELGEDLTKETVRIQLTRLISDDNFALNRPYEHAMKDLRVVHHKDTRYCLVQDKSIIEVATMFNRHVI